MGWEAQAGSGQGPQRASGTGWLCRPPCCAHGPASLSRRAPASMVAPLRSRKAALTEQRHVSGLPALPPGPHSGGTSHPSAGSSPAVMFAPHSHGFFSTRWSPRLQEGTRQPIPQRPSAAPAEDGREGAAPLSPPRASSVPAHGGAGPARAGLGSDPVQLGPGGGRGEYARLHRERAFRRLALLHYSGQNRPSQTPWSAHGEPSLGEREEGPLPRPRSAGLSLGGPVKYQGPPSPWGTRGRLPTRLISLRLLNTESRATPQEGRTPGNPESLRGVGACHAPSLLWEAGGSFPAPRGSQSAACPPPHVRQQAQDTISE